MLSYMYPFWSSLVAGALAQILKPFIYYVVKRKWKFSLIKESGGFPSSHSAIVTALALAVGIQEKFNSTEFAISLTLAMITVYDAANVRYYSGQNIKVTQQLIKDVQEELNIKFLDPIYDMKLKQVLGHKWFEVLGGIILGALVALIFHYGM